MAGVQDVLDSIPKLVADKDAAALQALREHADKHVRKAVGKALHTLKSRGVVVPEATARAWTTGDALRSMRGDLEPMATIDVVSAPGAMRFLISVPDATEGARLFAGALSPSDRVLEFVAYQQTDGQRTRLLRDWERDHGDRKVPVEWLKARIRWAREQTIASGFSVPRALDQALPTLGEAPQERPVTFLGPIADQPKFDASKVDEVLLALGVQAWPPLCNLDATLAKAAELHGDNPQPQTEEERSELIRQSSAGDPTLREGLRGPLASALEDAAIGMWLTGAAANAAAAAEMGAALRESEEPETLTWAPRLIGYQVASLLRAVGGPEAVARARAEAHDHDHDHE